MEIWIRDLTTDDDIRLVLPKETLPLKETHEYIIIDAPSGISEYDNIHKVNEVCKYCGDYTETYLKSYLLCEIIEVMESEDGYIDIINVTEESSGWAISDLDEIRGLVLYENGNSYFPCAIPEELTDYIRWEQNWYSAGTDGWRVIRHNGNEYLVKRYM